ncbi:MAG TPA: Holliday junction resolvase RuvX [Candidatus Saccharimonadales bacterium]|nr:Holliday junction resolvase RuvX [Candidatus Saccharimonadales bacterium]
MPTTHNSVLALDVGEKRIGVALASREARIASPLTTLPNDDVFVSTLERLLHELNVDTIVVGLPRNLAGDDTPQTSYVRSFVEQLQSAMTISCVWQDEAATSVKAEEELRARRKGYTREDIDALSAAYILEDYLGGTAN